MKLHNQTILAIIAIGFMIIFIALEDILNWLRKMPVMIIEYKEKEPVIIDAEAVEVPRDKMGKFAKKNSENN